MEGHSADLGTRMPKRSGDVSLAFPHPSRDLRGGDLAAEGCETGMDLEPSTLSPF